MKRKIAIAMLFLFAAVSVFSQETEAAYEAAGDAEQRGTIPRELLRPRRDENLRFPVDTVIGPLGRGEASPEAYRFARNITSALLAGDVGAPALSAKNRVLLESYMNVLDAANPRSYRIGSGRAEPDGSYSFLVRFVGRDIGITGELFIRFEERVIPAPVAAAAETEETAEAEETEATETAYDSGYAEAAAEEEPAPPPPPPPPQIVRAWVFEELILEEPRNRADEINETRLRFDFSPYTRFF